ncbi:MAG TPA: hypothetical protein VLF67_03355 [Candidatus Saccharimonas sp.]|nr:hypothetical protein [Candidatus Saccharimonas sp.]
MDASQANLVTILEPQAAVPDGTSLVVRRLSATHYVIEEASVNLILTETDQITADFQLDDGDTPDGPTSQVTSQSYRYRSHSGHWFTFRHEGGQLIVTAANPS